MAMTRLSDPTARMTLSRALLSEGLRLARSPLTAVHLVCGLAAGLACGEYFSVARWDPALGADAYVQFLGALMPLMSAIVCGLAVDEERAAGRLANLTAVPSRGRAVAAKLLALVALGAAALAVALGVFGAVLAVAGRLPLGPAPLAAAWAGIVLGSLPLYALGLWVALRLGRNAAIGAGAAGVLLAFFSVGGLAHGLMTGELTGALVTPLSWVPLAFVIARYFAYAFAAVATAWLASFMVLFVAISAGFVYEASWGPVNAREVAEGLARDGVCGQQDVPTAYRYLILNKDGCVLMTDLESTRLEDATEMARTALAADPGTVEIEGGGFGPHLRRVPAQERRVLRTRQRVPAAVGLARPRRPASQPAEPHARRRRGGKRARARARGTPCEPRDLAQDGAARGGGGARRCGRARLRGRKHQRA